MSKTSIEEKEWNPRNSEFEGEDFDNLQCPFDPNDIDVDISVVNLGSLLDQLEYEEIDLKPEFQRSSDVWSKEKKSRLIESVLLGSSKCKFCTSAASKVQKLHFGRDCRPSCHPTGTFCH